MRMWMIDPTMLCMKHLLGEHVELHMFVGTINKNKKLDGYRKNGLVEIHNIQSRHLEFKAFFAYARYEALTSWSGATFRESLARQMVPSTQE